MPVRNRFMWPAIVGAAIVILAAAMAGAEPAQAIDPSPFLLGTGIATPNVSSEVTALTGSAGTTLDIENVSPTATAIYGVASSTSGVTTGVYGKTNSNGGGSTGVNGVLNNGLPGPGSAGVLGSSFSTTSNGPGVLGQHLSIVGIGPGVLGETNSGSDFAAGLLGVVGASNAGLGSAGIRGINYGTGPTGVGIFGSQAGSGWGLYGTTTTGAGSVGFHTAATGSLPGMWGETYSNADGAMGVLGRVHSTTAGAGSVGVRGVNDSTGPAGVGVFGSQAGSGWGMYGQSPRGVGVVGASTTGYAGYFFGNVRITGSVGQSAGANVIDDPANPAHAYLRQAYVGSPDMKNIYDGVAKTDAKGYAVVKLPAYFQSLNKDYRYQLTSLSGLQQVAVAKEIAHNRFTIQSEKPGSRVSWQVTGIRKDRFASAHRIQPVEEKAKAEQGKYLDPQLYGQPRSKAIGANDQLGTPPAAPVAKAVKIR